MTIRWYPGHMGKAQEKMAEAIRKIDVIIEVLDARLPISSSNHLLGEMRRNKPCIKVLNKSDLADPAVTKAWVRYFEREAGVTAIPLSAKLHADAKKLIKLCQKTVPHRGKPGWPLRVMVFGIPNTGKSTLINTLAGKCIAKVGDKPAITTIGQQIDLKNGIVLTDTPGILWPNMDDQGGAYRLAASGAIGASALDYTCVGLFAAEYMLGRYPELVKERYKLPELPETAAAAIEAIGRRLGCLISGGEINIHRAAEAFLRELRAGKIGRISLEEPGEAVGLSEPAVTGSDN
ncbi:MAG: ribosome biogenesis GTPase YlqF [Desulfuromonadaceae bacterium]|nr:ribosome biogenesis GTPase YlqF [Desulfuromonadaceae bacterium]MDD5104578.1 ribosome biogenesis GTPase YlqF [Desulfuromonadaceae bacterium]